MTENGLFLTIVENFHINYHETVWMHIWSDYLSTYVALNEFLHCEQISQNASILRKQKTSSVDI